MMGLKDRLSPWSFSRRLYKVIVKWPSRNLFFRSTVGLVWKRVLQPSTNDRCYTHRLTVYNTSAAQPLDVCISGSEPDTQFVRIPASPAAGDYHSRSFTIGQNGISVWLRGGVAGQVYEIVLEDFGPRPPGVSQ